jgi:mono/diheme cytochrome c family protein
MIFLRSCVMCHGESGRGDGPLAATLPKNSSSSIHAAAVFRTWQSPGEPTRPRGIHGWEAGSIFQAVLKCEARGSPTPADRFNDYPF